MNETIEDSNKSPEEINQQNAYALKFLDQQIHVPLVVCLIGLPGCGKSTFTRRFFDLFRASQTMLTRSWIQCNQDYYKTRQKTINAASMALTTGYSVIIDRCNFDVDQRAHWIALANSFNAQCICIILPDAMDVELCASRANLRGVDDLHPDEIDWIGVCARMKADFRSPSLDEGFAAIYTCNEEFSVNNILDSLLKVSQ